MPAHRQSALLLHGLEASDRNWILERLADADRLLLGRHLAELKELGIPAEPGLAAARLPRRLPAAPATLETATTAQMQQLLVDEPAWLVRHLLALGAWPWRDAFLAALPAPQRARMAAAPAPLPAHAARRLLEQVASHLAQAPASAATSAAAPVAGALPALRLALRRWF